MFIAQIDPNFIICIPALWRVKLFTSKIIILYFINNMFSEFKKMGYLIIMFSLDSNLFTVENKNTFLKFNSMTDNKMKIINFISQFRY